MAWELCYSGREGWAKLLMTIGLAWGFGCLALARGQDAGGDPSGDPSGTEVASIPEFIREVRLDPDQPILIPAHPVMSTTIMFPGPIAAPIGAFYIDPAMSAEEVAGDWYLEFESGSNLLTIAPINDKSPPRNLNILFEDEVYVIIPFVAKATSEANALVRLTRSSESIKEANQRENLITKTTAGPQPFRNPSRGDLIAFMDELRVLATLEEARLEDFLEETNGYTLSVREGDESDYGPFGFRINRVVRAPEIDALGFFISIRNDTDRNMYLDPRSFFVRVGLNLYESALTDAPTVIASGVSVPAFFVIYGDGTGGRARLAPTNQFRIGAKVAFAAPSQSVQKENP